MAKDDDISKNVGDAEDEDLLDFDFDEDLLGEDEEKQEAEPKNEEEIIELADVVAEGKKPEAVEGEIEGLEELILEEEEGEEKQAPLSEGEEEADFAEEIELTEVVDEAAADAGRVPDHPSGKVEEIGEDTVLMERMEGALEEGPEEPFIDLEEEIKLDEGLEELVSEDEAQGLEEAFAEETGEGPEIKEPAEEILTGKPPVEGMIELEEELAQEGALPISEERIEALLAKVVGDVLERVARNVIPEVAEKIIREEIDVLKKSLMSEG
ncbi:MAG: hypothetical protein JRF50_16710 [Deltaproteobacteria bacterium]|nr:hypothetical protein [Deltaproteobacteria bacterium]